MHRSFAQRRGHRKDASSRPGIHPRRAAWSGAFAVAAAAVVAISAPAATAAPAPAQPDLKTLVAKIKVLAGQIDALGQKYDLLRIEYQQARQQAAVARAMVAQEEKLLASDQAAIGRIAATGYMTGSVNPALQLLQASDPQLVLGRVSVLTHLQYQNGVRVQQVAAARAAAVRAELAAGQAETRARDLAAAMKAQIAAIKAKESVLNSQAYAKAMSAYQQTGSYPNIPVSGSSAGARALRYALTKRGDMYLWGAAGPDRFDCSGLVVWAFAQIGISLPHYTGSQWNSGVHIARANLMPGDLVFFGADLGHVGFYMGGGLMVDAPSTGLPVRVEGVWWNQYAGAVRIGG